MRFVRLEDGTRLAYAIAGQGPALVCPAWWVSHLEEDWLDAGFRTLFGGLARHFTVVRYDRPGAGLSDRERAVVDLKSEVSTLEQLVRHLELEDVNLFAVSCAGPPALAYAAENPERVCRLVLFGSFLRGKDVAPEPVMKAIQDLVRAHWGLGARTITNLFAPDLDEKAMKHMSRQHRKAASPEMAARLVSLTFDVTAEDRADDVTAPVLVLHRKDDRTVTHAAGRELAASLPNATLESLVGNAHVPWLGDVDSVLRSVLTFLGAETDAESASSTPREPTENTFFQDGEMWRLGFDGQTVHLKAARGLTDLAILIANPGQEVHVGKLWFGAASAEAMEALGGAADPILDEPALASYRARFEELEEAIAEAEAAGTATELERHREERDALARELRSAVGIGGRKRGLGEPSERARKAVSARIRASLKKIAASHASLGEHLRTSVKTGNFCSYTPSHPVDWVLSKSR